jgi:two-component system chemotaxis response regulator CheB
MPSARLGGRPVDAVAIGASAGGVEAVSTLLAAIPSSVTQPLFVVIHLPRHRPSLLADVFSPISRRPVLEAEDKEPVTAGTVYLAPPDYHLMVEPGPSLALATDDLVNFSRPSIDVLFESAADTFGERLLAIVLTGASRDGTDGLRAVHEGGGCTSVQEPREAYASAMPESAIAGVPVDAVLPLSEIAALLASLTDAGIPAAAPQPGAN